MTGRLFGALSTAFGLVGLYLVLTNAGGLTQIARELGAGLIGIFRTLQGRTA